MKDNDKRKIFSGNRKPHSKMIDNPTANRELISMRLKAGYTQSEIAEMLHISRPLYAMIELNKRNGDYIMDDLKEIYSRNNHAL